MNEEIEQLRREISELRNDLRAAKQEKSETKGKDFWDILSALSGLIAGVVVAAIGIWATSTYNARQLDLQRQNQEQQSKLERVRVLNDASKYLMSDKQLERTYGYEMLVLLQMETFAAKIIEIKGDEAGIPTLNRLASHPDKVVQNAAKSAIESLSLQQIARIKAIVDIFETGYPEPQYGQVIVLSGDPAHLTYGRAQVTLASGNLYLLIRSYCEKKESMYAPELSKYLGRLELRDVSLDKDEHFISYLKSAGDDPSMQSLQEEFFDRVYMKPALAAAASIGVKTALGSAVIYDSRIHGSYQRLKDETIADLGGSPATGVDEHKWIEAYVKKRRDWMTNHPIEMVQRMVYRMDAFLTLINEGNWDLTPPLTVRKKKLLE
jgi:hypothetical protein